MVLVDICVYVWDDKYDYECGCGQGLSAGSRYNSAEFLFLFDVSGDTGGGLGGCETLVCTFLSSLEVMLMSCV